MSIHNYSSANKLRDRALGAFSNAKKQLEAANVEFEKQAKASEERTLELRTRIEDELNGQKFAADRIAANAKTITKISELLA